MKRNETLFSIINGISEIEMALEKQHAVFSELLNGHFGKKQFNIYSDNKDEQLEALYFLFDYPHNSNLFQIAFDYHNIVIANFERLSENINLLRQQS